MDGRRSPRNCGDRLNWCKKIPPDPAPRPHLLSFQIQSISHSFELPTSVQQMSGRRNRAAAGKPAEPTQIIPPAPPAQEQPEKDESESTSSSGSSHVISATSQDATGSAGSTGNGHLSESDDNVSTSAAEFNSAATTTSAGDSSSSSSGGSCAAGGTKPSEKELTAETKKIREEKESLKLALLEDQLALIDKRLTAIQSGTLYLISVNYPNPTFRRR